MIVMKIFYWLCAIFFFACGIAHFATGDYAMSLASLAVAEINVIKVRLEK